MGQTSELSYDANGNLRSVTDPLGRVTSRTYDAMDRVSALADAAGGVTGYAYDAVGNVTNITDSRGLVTGYRYDALNRRDLLDSPDSGILNATFDANGNLVEQTDSRGVTLSHSYDALDRRTETGFPATGDAWTFLYDDQGTNGVSRLYGYDDESGQTRLGYDARGNIVSETRTIQAQIYNLGYAYDQADNLAAITYPSGLTIAFSYDDQGGVKGITADGQPVLSDVAYLPFGPATIWTDGSGLQHTETYDNDYRPTAIIVNSIQDVEYLYDAADNITHWIDVLAAENTQTLDYDDLDRLIDADGPYGAVDITYDVVGNRLSKTVDAAITDYAYAADSNRLQETTGADPGTYSYDAAGNLIQDSKFSYLYNQANRLAEVRQGGATIAGYLYNAEGQRVAKTVGGQAIHYVFGPEGVLIGVYDAATGAPIEEIVYFGNIPVATIRGGSIYYIHTDHLGTPRLIGDHTQTIIWRWNSDPFGEDAPDENPDGDGSAFVFNLRFPGQYYDQESEKHYNYFRDYDPVTGRYVQSDPIGLVGGLNTYLYANGNPVKYSDPQGLIAPAIVAGAIAYGRCLAECAVIEAAIAAIGACPPGIAAAAASCAVDCLNPLNWLPGSKVFKAAKKAKQAQKAYKAKKAADRARQAKKAAEKAKKAKKAKKPTPKEGSTGGKGEGKGFSEKTKEQARAESGNTCVFCGTKTAKKPGPTRSEIDHTVPKSRGGNNTLDNAQNTCRTCNRQKGAKTTKEFVD